MYTSAAGAAVMPETSQIIGLDGHAVWAYAVFEGDEVRVRVPLDDWERSELSEGRRIPVRLGTRRDVWMFVKAVVDLPRSCG